MKQAEEMLQMVLKDNRLRLAYPYDLEEVLDLDLNEACSHENAVVATVARIIRDLDGSMETSKQNEVYKKVFNYLNTKLIV
jgi:transcriptional regulator NrdR family protein